MPKLSADHRRALELLAGNANGRTGSLLLAYRVTPTLLAELIPDGLASADTECMMAGGKAVEVRRFRVTPARRAALSGAGSDGNMRAQRVRSIAAYCYIGHTQRC